MRQNQKFSANIACTPGRQFFITFNSFLFKIFKGNENMAQNFIFTLWSLHDFILCHCIQGDFVSAPLSHASTRQRRASKYARKLFKAAKTGTDEKNANVCIA